MSVPPLVEQFYRRIWEGGENSAAEQLLAPDFHFRGSLGTETVGIGPFLAYVRSVCKSLAGYRCAILDCVFENETAFARMHFSGIHVQPFRGFPPTGKPIAWAGAALFHIKSEKIASLWVLGDLAGLDEALKQNAAP